MDRRRFITVAGTAMLISPLARATDAALTASLEQSPLIYVAPIKADGGLSSCQAEVWFQLHRGALYVVTGKDAWRARAIDNQLFTARVWVGDVGVWDDSDGRYLELPHRDARVSYERNTYVHGDVLEKMGSKYSREWGTWGPRFKNGLADGSRVMLRYVLS